MNKKWTAPAIRQLGAWLRLRAATQMTRAVLSDLQNACQERLACGRNG
jgi:hypothetical protein